MGEPANFVLVKANLEEIHILDVGPWDKHLTVTNDAENVIKLLGKGYGMTDDTKVYCTDSNGDKGELLHEGREFKGFA